MNHDWTADKIRNLRLELGWSQVEMAHATGVTRNAVTAWETGKRSPTAHRTHALETIRTLIDYEFMPVRAIIGAKA